MSKDSITATVTLKLKPWQVPNFAVRADRVEGAEASSVHVSDLDEDALEDMALAWVRELYTKAGQRYCPFRKQAKAEPTR